MPSFHPFRAYNYSAGRRKQLKKLLCPPYDVINETQRQQLLQRHPENFIRLELPEGPGLKRYANAATLFKTWLQKGVLERESQPLFYVYQASFPSQVTGKTLSRWGVFGALEVVPWGEGIFPHEKTLPTPKADRLRLFKALKTQTSPIQVLAEDRRGAGLTLLRAHGKGTPWAQWKDDSGVTHRLWPWAGGAALSRWLGKSQMVIADGHHRYETARAYGEWARGRGGKTSPAASCVMALICSAADPALEILPTHRAVGSEKARFVQLEDWGTFKPLSGLKALRGLMEGRSKEAGGVGVFREEKFGLYQFSRLPPPLRGTPQAPLAVARLHGGPLDGLGKEDFFFTRRPEEAVAFARRHEGWAFFLPPNSVAEVLRVATSGAVMPPKSTYFYPKIPSGILSMSLQGEL